MKRDRTRKGPATWILALVALLTWLGAGMAINFGMPYAPAAASNGDDPALNPETMTIAPSERTVLPLGAPGEENPPRRWTVRVEDADGVGVAGLLEGDIRRLYVSAELGSRLRVLPIIDAAASGRPGDYFVTLAAVAGAEPGSQHAARVTVARPGFGALVMLITVVIGNPGQDPGDETDGTAGDGPGDDTGDDTSDDTSDDGEDGAGVAAHSTHVTSYPPPERVGDVFQSRVAPGGTVWARITFYDAELNGVADGTVVAFQDIGVNPGIIIALPRGTWRSLLGFPTARGVLDPSTGSSTVSRDRGVTEGGSVHLVYIASPTLTPSAAPQRIVVSTSTASTIIEVFVGAADGDPYVLPLEAGGQFVRATFNASAADLFEDRVTVAWKYAGLETGWIRYIPALGQENFIIAPGDFLWVVSPGSQTLAVP